jgi:dienelactone hydrolase
MCGGARKLLRFVVLVLAVQWLAPSVRAQESVSFLSLDARVTGGAPTTLRGLLFRPAGDGPFPAVVGLHGCGGLFNRQGKLVGRETAWAETLTERGYVVLFPDSFGPRGVTSACADGRSLARPWAERSSDVYGALRYLQSLPFVIGERVGLIGWSHGGGTVLFAISATGTARPADLPKGDFRAAVAFYPGWCKAAFLGGGWTTAIPFLLEIGASDDWTEAAPCVETVQSAIAHGAPARMMVYDGAFHDFDWPGMELHSMTPRPGKIVHTGLNPEARADALTRVPAFFDGYLKP